VRVLLGLLLTISSSLSAPLAFTSSNLPIVIIDTRGVEIPDAYRISGQMKILYKGIGQRNSISDPTAHYVGRIAIEIRGSSSTAFPKKQYGLETQDSLGGNLNVSLLGLPAENDWVLYAPYDDKSLMRNVLAYDLSRRIGRYASRCVFCELVLNNDYRGVYVLMEKIKRDKNRVAISSLKNDDLTGGYLFKVDKYSGENNAGWVSLFPPHPAALLWQRTDYLYHDPDPDEISDAQKQYLQDYMSQWERMMYDRAFNDPVDPYYNTIDAASFVDYVLLTEVCKNVDGYRLSLFLTKERQDKGGRLAAGPIWDFNIAFGNADYYNGLLAEGWMLGFLTTNRSFMYEDKWQPPFWWKKLLDDPWFGRQVQARWQELRKTVLATGPWQHYIDSTAVYLDESQRRNFVRWPIMGKYVWPNGYIGASYADEIRFLKQWLATRMEWMDHNWSGLLTRVESATSPLVEELAAFPNPFNRSVTLEYQLPRSADVEIHVFDRLGRLVQTLQAGRVMPGTHRLTWDGADDNARTVSSGVYFCRFRANYGDQHIERTLKWLMLR
jgi:hypothetical protein